MLCYYSKLIAPAYGLITSTDIVGHVVLDLMLLSKDGKSKNQRVCGFCTGDYSSPLVARRVFECSM
jgi:hypothetical protein